MVWRRYLSIRKIVTVAMWTVGFVVMGKEGERISIRKTKVVLLIEASLLCRLLLIPPAVMGFRPSAALYGKARSRMRICGGVSPKKRREKTEDDAVFTGLKMPLSVRN